MRYLKVFENFNKRKFDELELDDIEDFLMGVVDERKLSISELVKYDKEKKQYENQTIFFDCNYCNSFFLLQQ